MLAQLDNYRSDIDVPFALANGDIKAGQLIEPITLYLTFVVSSTASPPVLPIDATNLQSTEANALALRRATTSMAQDPADVVRSTVVTERGTFTPPTHNLNRPSTPMSSVADPRADLPSTENALEIANKAMTAIKLSDTWEGALGRIKWVMDTVSPVAEVRYGVLSAILYLPECRPQLSPYAKMAHGLLFAIPKVIRLRYRRSDILTLCLYGHLDPPRTI